MPNAAAHGRSVSFTLAAIKHGWDCPRNVPFSIRNRPKRPQGAVDVDLRPQDRIQALKRPPRIKTVGQDLAGVPAKEPGTRQLEVESLCRERFTFLTVEPILVAGVGVVSQQHPDVGGVLARCDVSSVVPGPDLQKR